MATTPAVPTAPDPDRLARILETTERPYVTLKAAATLDGRIATRTGESRWITGEAARHHTHALRAAHEAILVGIGTVLADDPQLTARLPGARSPVRVVLDSRARIRPEARCLAGDGVRRIVVAGRDAPPDSTERLRTQGVEVVTCRTPRPQPEEFLPRLRAAGIGSILVEGGAQVHGNLIAHRAGDELFLYLAGLMLGDLEAPAWCAPLGIDRLAQAPRVALAEAVRVGEDVLLHGFFPRASSHGPDSP